MAELGVRNAVSGDAARIAEIYNFYVLHSTITFDTEPKTEQDRAQWLEEHDERHPVLVGEVDGHVVVWGALTKWGARSAYRHTVEISVYVDRDAVGRGVGEAMTAALISEATRHGHHVVISQIVSDNEASLRLAKRTGFEQVGVLREVGRKFDRWLDVVILEKVLDVPRELAH